MIHCCGRLTSGQVTKILGVFQLIGAIIITSVGIGVVVQFIEVDHVQQSNGEIADTYVEMHWTVRYGAAIWMGLIMAIAGAYGCFADVKPHKSKYIYGTIIVNVIVTISAILLVVFSYHAINWFETCKYTYHVTTKHGKFVRDCSTDDKSKGQTMYWIIFIVTLLMIPLTICVIVLLVIVNRVLFEDGIFDGCCNSKSTVTTISNANNNTGAFNKNKHRFNGEMKVSTNYIENTAEPQNGNVGSASEYTKPSVYC